MKPFSIVFLAVMLLCGCGAKASSFDDLVKAGDVDVSKPHGKEYENAFTAHGELQPPEGVNLTNCPEGSKPFTIVLVVNDQGHVTESYSSPESDESKCIAKEFSAHEYPIPPFAPFHIVMEWDR